MRAPHYPHDTPALSRATGGPRLSVLLVEDDRADALLVEELIADANVDVDFAWTPSISDAQSAMAHNRPDCVLLDLNLPDASGIGALERISKSDPSIPIVVLTGLNDEHFGISAVASGAQDYLVKGRVEPETLRRSLLYAIERKRAELTAVELHASRIRAGENARLERGLQPSPLLLDDPGVDVITRYRASRAYALLGGDFYDVVQTPDRTVHVMIGDVAGHGPDEAALGVALRIGWRALTFAGLRGNERMHQLERILFAERPAKGIFATLLSLAFAPDSLRFTAVRAGHPGVLVHGNNDVQWLEPPAGPALGLGAHEWPVSELELPEGHGLLLLTDGLFEGHSGRGNERLGEDGLLELARSLAGLPGSAFVDELIGEVEARARTHGGHTDDIAVVRVERTNPMTAPRGGPRPHRAGMAEPRAVRHGGVGAYRSDRRCHPAEPHRCRLQRVDRRHSADPGGGLSVAGSAAGSGDGAAGLRDRGRPTIPRAVLRRATRRTIRGRRNPQSCGLPP